MKCERCKHPLSAHFPMGCERDMWTGGICEARCRMFVFPPKKVAPESEAELRAAWGDR